MDSFGFSLGVVLTHTREGDFDHAIYLTIKGISQYGCNYTTFECQGLYMIYPMHMFHHCMLGGHFKFFNDPSVLKYLVNKPILEEHIFIWLLLLHELSFEVVVRLGR